MPETINSLRKTVLNDFEWIYFFLNNNNFISFNDQELNVVITKESGTFFENNNGNP